MPVTESNKKALRRGLRRRQRNIVQRKNLRAVLKTYKKTLADSPEEASKKLPELYKTLDKAAKVNLIKKNKADRLKSRLTKQLTKVSSK